ncbi:hypothetical protein [Seonamhaeicola sp.]|uniref:hypothetical protein n=1 Tax=Seonamhaeicola sp. TaxID=1912245 RepID=UPI00260D4514|nr:hypothetical protein [Seonamhaeicola sp.]
MSKIYSTRLEKPSEPKSVNFMFFEDNDLKIGATATWTSGLKIEKIEFVPKSKHFDDNFQIIDINPCTLDDSGKAFFMVHIWRSKYALDKEPYISLASDDLLGFELKYEYDIELFLFHIHEVDKKPTIDNSKACDFPVLIPETKEGAIIIGI